MENIFFTKGKLEKCYFCERNNGQSPIYEKHNGRCAFYEIDSIKWPFLEKRNGNGLFTKEKKEKLYCPF